MVIGDENVFEVGSSMSLSHNFHCTNDEAFAGKCMGQNNVIEIKAHVAENTAIGDNCVIGALCRTSQNQIIPSRTVISGNGEASYRASQGKVGDFHGKHLEYLRQTLPLFNHVQFYDSI